MKLEKIKELEGSLVGKIILLTGAGGGIGLEALKTFAYMGAKVIVAEIDKEKIESALENLKYLKIDRNIEFYLIDLGEEKQLYELY